MSFEFVKKNFGFGCMRFPTVDGKANRAEICRMFDAFLEAGFNYFDTAHGYMKGDSESIVRECLVERYPRESFVLTDKLSSQHFTKNEEIRPLFAKQLAACGVEYFDFYLMHAQDRNSFAKYKTCRAYETALELRAEGKIRHLGISFHDKAEVLSQILAEYPQIEVVQIQLNYLDYEDATVESRKCLEVCQRYGKPVIVMEPVKGGSLVKLPDTAQAIFDALHGGSNASYAIRFAAGQEGVFMVLSGMSTLEMVEENVGFMRNFKPLTDAERTAVDKVSAVLRGVDVIPCTECRYCTEVCPKGLAIPDLFSCYNSYKVLQNWNAEYYYNDVLTLHGGKASECVGCGACEGICPQHLPIRKLLRETAALFEKE